MTMSSRTLGYGLAAVGSALFSTKSIFIKLAYGDQMNAALMLGYRMLFAMPFYIAIGIWALNRQKARGLPLPTRTLVAQACLAGFFGYYLASEFDFAGLLYISAQLERLVLFTYPLFVMFIGAYLHKQPVTRIGLLAAGITYLGLTIVLATDLSYGGINTVIGTALVLTAALTFAIHQLMAKGIIADLGSALYTSIALTAAGILCITHAILFAGALSTAPTPRFLWLTLGCSLVATVAPTFLLSAALARVSAASIAMISTLSPLVTVALAVAILDETFTASEAAGALLVLAGVGLFTWGDMKTTTTRPADVA